MLKKYSAVVFDMDGLLVDSERIALTTFIEACKIHGFAPDIEVYYKCIGTNSVRTSEIMTEGYGPDFPFQSVYDLWKKQYHFETLEKDLPLKKGALSLLEYLESTKNQESGGHLFSTSKRGKKAQQNRHKPLF
jgi:beta-phosphoglucomutase-like phosphatase (HAD superfamily)